MLAITCACNSSRKIATGRAGRFRWSDLADRPSGRAASRARNFFSNARAHAFHDDESFRADALCPELSNRASDRLRRRGRDRHRRESIRIAAGRARRHPAGFRASPCLWRGHAFPRRLLRPRHSRTRGSGSTALGNSLGCKSQGLEQSGPARPPRHKNLLDRERATGDGLAALL